MIPDNVSPLDLAKALCRQDGGAIPATCTIADLARALGVSERWVSSMKAAGRVPVTPSGKIDLHEIARMGVERIGRKAGSPGLAAEMAHELGLATGAAVATFCVQRAIAGDGADAVAAAERGLREALAALGLEEAAGAGR